MNALPLNKKSLSCIKHNGFLTVYEGAVRSAKTVTSLVQFYRRILSSRDSVFLMSGNTQGSISRNCILGDYGFIEITGGKAEQKTDTDGSKYLSLPPPEGDPRKEIKIFYVGADNAASYKKIRGISIGGWYADEINLHDRDFIETAEARSFAALDRFMIWTLNPDLPGAWIYEERIDRYLVEGIDGYKYQHFTIDDNPALTEERKAQIKAQYIGVFYQRYVLGLRVRAEGSCFPSFSEKNILSELPQNILFVQIGADPGGNKSATCYAATAFFVKDNKLCACLIDEMYDKENKSAESILENFRQFVERQRKNNFVCSDAFTDSAEQLIKKSMQNLGVCNVYDSLKKPIIDRIRFFDLMYSQNRMFILSSCGHTIQAVRSSVFDPKAKREERLDNGSVNIDSIDAFEYSVESRMKEFI